MQCISYQQCQLICLFINKWNFIKILKKLFKIKFSIEDHVIDFEIYIFLVVILKFKLLVQMLKILSNQEKVIRTVKWAWGSRNTKPRSSKRPWTRDGMRPCSSQSRTWNRTFCVSRCLTGTCSHLTVRGVLLLGSH